MGCNLLCEIREGPKRIAVARYELRTPSDVSQGAESIVLEFKEPIRMIEGQRPLLEWHWLEWHELRITNLLQGDLKVLSFRAKIVSANPNTGRTFFQPTSGARLPTPKTISLAAKVKFNSYRVSLRRLQDSINCHVFWRLLSSKSLVSLIGISKVLPDSACGKVCSALMPLFRTYTKFR